MDEALEKYQGYPCLNCTKEDWKISFPPKARWNEEKQEFGCF